MGRLTGLSGLRSALAPLAAVFAPGAVFRREAVRPRPLASAAGVLALTLASAWSLGPFLRDATRAAGLDPAAGLVRTGIAIKLGVLTPADAALFLLVLAGLLWTVSVVSGGIDTDFATCVVIASVASITEVLRRGFALLVLWLRASRMGGAQGSYEVYTGLDLFFEPFRSGPPLLVSLSRHLGLFEVWLVILLGIGLVETRRMSARAAALTASLAYGLVLLLLVGGDLLAT